MARLHAVLRKLQRLNDTGPSAHASRYLRSVTMAQGRSVAHAAAVEEARAGRRLCEASICSTVTGPEERLRILRPVDMAFRRHCASASLRSSQPSVLLAVCAGKLGERTGAVMLGAHWERTCRRVSRTGSPRSGVLELLHARARAISQAPRPRVHRAANASFRWRRSSPPCHRYVGMA